MDLVNKTPILTEELRMLAAEHTQLENMIKGTNPLDEQVLKGLKRQKLQLRDQMWAVLNSLPPAQIRPTDPKLFALTDSELHMEFLKRQRMFNRRAERVGQNAFELTRLRSNLREVEFEIDRRELEALFAEESVIEAA